MNTADTHTSTIFVGLKGAVCGYKKAEKICQEYVDRIGYCVTITKTRYVYKGGNEDGIIVGLINYPRFPESVKIQREKAFRLATLLKEGLRQTRVSVICGKKTYTIGDMDVD
jgi:hypothetical protein